MPEMVTRDASEHTRSEVTSPTPTAFLVPGRDPLPLLSIPALASEAAREPPIRGWTWDGRTTILRQSLATHFEAPFIKLLVGSSRALLIDTGTGDADLRGVVDRLLAGTDVELVVAHTHAHTDHTGGDGQFAGRKRTSVVGHSVSDVWSAFALEGEGVATIDLGDRAIDVIFIPGHEAAHIAFYDRDTGVLFTGDTLYPGRLYVRDWNAYRASIGRLVSFVDRHPITHVIGAHIELSAANDEYPERALVHPDEHPLPLGESHLRDLRATVDAMAATPVRTKRASYVVVPLF
jgi:hydroxyacylglutathione hydrolase